jgi:hypothetical protein
MNGLQAAVSSGQHDEANGLFYAGQGPCWSHVIWRQVLQKHGRLCKHLAWVDLHTGLGPCGHGERILSCRDDGNSLSRARAWWGQGVTSQYEGSSVSTRLSGMAYEAIYQECPQAQYTGIAIEFGTKPMHDVLHALRADQWQENHSDVCDALRQTIKRQVRDAFYIDDNEWKSGVVYQAHQAVLQAITGLGSSD